MAKKEIATLERIYNVPLRKEYQKVPRWRKTKKAVFALRQFLIKHMKSENVKLGKELNEKLWQNGIRNPPHHIKVTVTKDDKGLVKAELFGVEKKEVKAPVKKVKAVKEEKAEELKAEEQKEEVQETPAIEEAKEEVKEKKVKKKE